MKLDHIALWVNDLEKMKDFFINYFQVSSNEKYSNPKKEFTSYFLSFPKGGRIEIMHRPDIFEYQEQKGLTNGLTHLAISVGGKNNVDTLTELLRRDGYTIAGEPRTTGDGFYESVILDPEGNPIEITE